MYEPIKKEQKQHALFLKAIANPVRIYLLEVIGKDRVCVCSLAKRLNMSFGAISKHFSVLKHAGIVYEERVGNNIFYRVSCDCIFELIEKVKETFAGIERKRLL